MYNSVAIDDIGYTEDLLSNPSLFPSTQIRVNQSSEVVAVVELLLDGEQSGGVPRVEAGDLVVLLHLLREPVHVLLLALLDEGLKQFLGMLTFNKVIIG